MNLASIASAARANGDVNSQGDPLSASQPAIEVFRGKGRGLRAFQRQDLEDGVQGGHRWSLGSGCRGPFDRREFALHIASAAPEPAAFEALPEQESGPVQPGPEVRRRDPDRVTDLLAAQAFQLAEEEGVGEGRRELGQAALDGRPELNTFHLLVGANAPARRPDLPEPSPVEEPPQRRLLPLDFVARPTPALAAALVDDLPS